LCCGERKERGFMDSEQFDKVDKLADDVYEKFDDLYKQGVLADLESKMKEICVHLKKEYSVSINFDLEVFSDKKEQTITLIKRGMACFKGDSPYLATSGSTAHRYIVDGQIVKLPHDYCPNCWGEWDFKLLHNTCPYCDYSIGKEIKLLLDTDVCPNCEDGKVSLSNPQCQKCGVKLESGMVSWG
jgi:ribosomal protein L32